MGSELMTEGCWRQMNNLVKSVLLVLLNLLFYSLINLTRTGSLIKILNGKIKTRKTEEDIL